VPSFWRQVLADAELYLMQSQDDATRAIALGAPRERVIVVGRNLKYDLNVSGTNPLTSWLEGELARSRRQPLLVAGSVVAGEEPSVLEALAIVTRKWPEALLVLAPRKPERFDSVAKMIEQAGWRVIRRSTLSLDGTSAGILTGGPGEPRSVLLLDSIGELAAVYRLADGVFVGGSLVPAGGHNPLEPAAFGKVPLFGPSMESFRDIVAGFLRAEAAIEVHSGADLGEAWLALLEDANQRTRMGKAARDLVESHRGATAATLEHLAPLLVTPRAVR
jgi:3-deoxy-D-manno-octulosonic-acid transferase